MTKYLIKNYSNLFKSKNVLKKPVSFCSSGSDKKPKYIGKKWQEGSLFERVQKIEKIEPGNDKTPLHCLFPRTMKQNTPIFPPNLRVGALGIKLGLTNLTILPDFKHIVCTMVHIKDCEVIQHIVSENLNYKVKKHSLIVGMGIANEEDQKYLTYQQKLYYQKLGIPPKITHRGFSVHESNILPVGTKIHAQHFTPGQRVDAVSTSKDKGFLGVMQRWGFKGLPASHGVSKYHRGRGSLCHLKNRVAPRTKMAGHAGLEKRFVMGVEVLRVNTEHNVIYLKGTIPGPIGGIVLLRDAFKNPDNVEIHYPTFYNNQETLSENLFSKSIVNPWENYKHKVTK